MAILDYLADSHDSNDCVGQMKELALTVACCVGSLNFSLLMLIIWRVSKVLIWFDE